VVAVSSILRSLLAAAGRSRSAQPTADGWQEPVGLLPAGPDAVTVGARQVRVGDQFSATLAVTGYPAEVSAGWLELLLAHPGRLDVAVHIEPVPPAVAADRLRKQRARLESSRRVDHQHGRLDDPDLEAAAADAADLAGRIARGEGKLFRTGLYLTVHAATETQLAEEVARVRSVAASMLLEVQPVTWRALQGWITSLPLACDPLRMRRTIDTAALAAEFPFTSPDLPAPRPAPDDGHPQPGPVLYGTNTASAGVVVWDRWSADNHNLVVLAPSGAGKSYFATLELRRNLYQGVDACVIDPEHEYTYLADYLGGTVIALGERGVHLNPLDLPTQATAAPTDALIRRALFLHTLTGVLLGRTLEPDAAAALDRAVTGAYQHAGITADPRTWRRPAPLLADVATALSADPDPAGPALAAQLAPYVSGSFSGLFAGPTTRRPDGHLVVFTLRDLPDELTPAATLLALDVIWSRLSSHPGHGPRHRTLVLVDEAWLLLRDGIGADWLFKLAKRARKYSAGLTLVTQDVGDVLSTDLGRAICSNAATQVLMRQAPQAIDRVAQAFGLTAGERALLLSARRGEGLLIAGNHRVGFHALASPTEHAQLVAARHQADDDEDDGPLAA
jgi:type IV secretory pathway VirB4 component